MDIGIFVQASREAVGEFLNRWLRDTASQKVRPRTLDDYRSLVTRHLLPRIGHLPLAQLRTDMLDRAYAEMHASGLSARTIAYAHSVLHGALDHAVKRGLLAKNPAAGATRPRTKTREMQSLTPEEAGAFLAAAAGSRFESLWVLLVTSGIRPAEALGLEWADLQDDAGTIQRSLVHLRDGSTEEDAPKTDKARRTVALPQATIASLRQHKIGQNIERLAAGPRWQENDYIFCNHIGGPLEWRVVARRYFRPLIARANLKRFRPYDLRHTCASLLLKHGEHAKVVSERLGHAKVAFTLDVYGHVLPGMQQAAAKKLQGMLFGDEPTAKKESSG